MDQVRDFPYEQLLALSSAQAALLDAASRWAQGQKRLVCPELAEVLGYPLEMSVRRVSPSAALRKLDGGSQLVVLEHASSGERLLLEVDGAAALVLVWSSLAESTESFVPVPRPLSQVEQGVLLYGVSRVLWSLWGPSSPFRIIGLGDNNDLATLSREGVSLYVQLEGGPLHGHAWIHLPPSFRNIIPKKTSPTQDLQRLALLPCPLHVVLGLTTLSAAQIAQLEHGDALILEHSPRAANQPPPPTGSLWLRLPLGGPRWEATLSEEGKLHLDRALDPWKGETMENADNTLPKGAGELLEEIPAEISIELGRVPLNAKEAAELRPGQTLKLDRAPGDPVDLRIGPKLIGRGELVQIDGQLGVVLREIFETQ